MLGAYNCPLARSLDFGVAIGSHILPAVVVLAKQSESGANVSAGRSRHVEGQDDGAEGCWRAGRRMLVAALRAMQLIV